MITKEEFNHVLHRAKGLRAIVIGDVMIDKYIYGSVDRISPEAPVPIVNWQRTETKAGGAANVAVNLSAWGCQTMLIGLVGKDDHAATLADLLEEKKIQYGWIENAERPTTVKTRIVASSHHLLRIDEESSTDLNPEEEKKAIDQIDSLLHQFAPELLIIEDYNKGFLTPGLINHILEYGRSKDVFIAVDPKEKNFFSYTNINLFKPNLREASIAHQKPLEPEDLWPVAQQWQKDLQIDTIAITLGAHGVFITDQKKGIQVLPEKSIDVIDVCGAGDAVICALALGLFAGLGPEKSGSLGNLAGAYVCSHSGVVAVSLEEIYHWI